MTELTRPTTDLHRSWAEAVAEYGEEFMHGSGLWALEDLDTTEEGCAEAVEFLLAQADPSTELAENIVHCTYFWITDGDEFVGYLALRHSLTQWLLDEGGHIGFSVRPSRRREGHARRALGLSLIEAKALGLDRVLVTCDDDNEGSRRTIEACGGVFEDQRKRKLRYWIDVESSPARE